MAVNGIESTMTDGSITMLLGHNGAGAYDVPGSLHHTHTLQALQNPVNVNVNELRLGFSNTTRNPEGILSHNNRKS